MKQFVAMVFAFLPLFVSSYNLKVGILSHDLDPDTTKEIWLMAQNYSTMMSLEPVVEMAQWQDIDNAAKFSRSICSLMKKGIDALVYLGSPQWNSFISSYATHVGLPFVAGGINNADFGQNEVCLLPDTTEAAADVIMKYSWDHFIFFYDSDNDPDSLQKVFSSLLSVEPIPRIDGFWKIDSIGQALHYIQYLPSSIRRRIVLATSEEFADTLSNSVNKSDILLLTPVGTIKKGSHRRENTLIKFSVIEPSNPVIIDLENRLKTLPSFTGQEKPGGKDIPDSAILHYDSSSILDTTFNKMAREKPSAMRSRNKEDCFEFSTEVSTSTDFLKRVHVVHGGTGNITFDEKGRRRDYQLTIIQSNPYGDMKKVGTWSDRYRLQMLRNSTGPRCSLSYAAQEKKSPIKVITIQNTPFLDIHNHGVLSGYAVDFLNELSKEVKMDFHLQLVKDGKYGALVQGEWNGIIGELVRGEADMAVALLRKNIQRQEVVHFSKNIMSSGLNILLKKPESEVESLTFAPFTFLSIWSAETWFCIIVAVAIFSAGSYAISRFIGPSDRVRALESKGTDDFSPCGSVWFTVGSLFCRDTGIYPRYITHRLWTLLWWIFCIFVGVLYVSMLTAALFKVRATVTTTHSIKTSQEVLKEYVETGLPVIGALKGGSTAKSFVNSSFDLYRQFSLILEANPDSMALNYEEGIERVRRSGGKYGFIMSSDSAEFISSQEPCDTLVTPGHLFSTNYAVILPKNSTLKEIIDHGILNLTEKGVLRQLYEKWWHTKSFTCEDPTLNILPKVYNTAMTLHEVSGVFYLFILFSVLSIVVAAVEYFFRPFRNVEREN